MQKKESKTKWLFNDTKWRLTTMWLITKKKWTYKVCCGLKFLFDCACNCFLFTTSQSKRAPCVLNLIHVHNMWPNLSCSWHQPIRFRVILATHAFFKNGLNLLIYKQMIGSAITMIQEKTTIKARAQRKQHTTHTHSI